MFCQTQPNNPFNGSANLSHDFDFFLNFFFKESDIKHQPKDNVIKHMPHIF